MTRLWETGVYLGVMGKSNEVIVGDGKGGWKTRSVHRKPLGEMGRFNFGFGEASSMKNQ